MSASCPEPEDVAAYADGRSTGAARAAIEEHLATCEDCYALLAETMHVQQALGESVPAVSKVRPAGGASRRGSIWFAMAALVLIAVAAGLWMRERTRAPMRQLADATAGRRLVEPRLTGFAHARLSATRSVGPRVDPDLAELYAAAGALERQARAGDASPELMGAVGVARLLLDDADAAVAALEQASEREPGNARLLSDLAAAYLVRARQGQAADWPRALQAAEQAVALDRAALEAHFNRALALEGLALREQAREAWQRYLTLDGSSGWADEARERLARLAAARSREAPSDASVRVGLRSALAGASDAALDAAVAAAPLAARQYLEEEGLAEWGGQMAAGLEVSASATRVSRLAARLGGEDRLLRDAVDALRSTPDPVARSALARGHVAYGRGKTLHDAGRYLDARVALETAAASFARARSSFELLPQYYLAVIRRTTNPGDATAEALDALVASARQQGAFDVLGRLLRLRGLLLVGRARHVEALEDYAAAIDAFESAGLVEPAVSMRSLMAESLDLLGDDRTAWSHRVIALESLPRVSSRRQRYVILYDAAAAALDQELPAAALPIAGDLVRVVEAWGDPAARASANRLRALAHDRLGHREPAEADLAAARRWIAESAADDVRRSEHEATAHAIEGQIASAHTPARAIEALDRALGYFVATGRQTRLPPLYLYRGRSHAALGRAAAAADDFERGIAAFEDMRRSLAPERQISFFDRAWDLFDERIALEVRRGAFERALAYGERARSRQLLEALAGPARHDRVARAPLGLAWQPLDPAGLRAALPRGVVLVYYTMQPERLLAWTLDADACRFLEIPVATAEVRRRVVQLRAALERADPAESARLDFLLASLGRLLLAPLAGRDDATVVFVPDDVLQLVPFAALTSPRTGRPLVRDHAVGLAPGGTLFVQASSASFVAEPSHALVIGNPAARPARGPRLRDLPQAESEAAEVAALYPSAATLVREAATRSRVLEALPAHDVVHFGGHAVSDSQMYSSSHLLLTPETPLPGSGDLFLHEIPRESLRRVRLVVLAACRTAAGPLSRSEGVLSLARPLLANGVPSVVASLWDVDDHAGRRLSVAFHRAYRETGSPLQALRRAQIALLDGPDPRDRHPSAWAPYVAIGGDPSFGVACADGDDCLPPGRRTLQAENQARRP